MKSANVSRLGQVLPELVPKGIWDEGITNELKALLHHNPSESQKLSISGLLLWNDDTVFSHEVSQDLPSSDGSYWHGIMHRREPDYSNSKYWFRKVGDHTLFPELLKKASALSFSGNSSRLDSLQAEITQAQSWDPFRFIDICEEAEKRSDPDFEDAVKKIQLVEIELLLDHVIAR